MGIRGVTDSAAGGAGVAPAAAGRLKLKPHFPQNLAAATFSWLQLGQVLVLIEVVATGSNLVPQDLQNLALSVFSALHWRHFKICLPD